MPRSNALVNLLMITGVRVSEAPQAPTADNGHNAGHRTLTVLRKGGTTTGQRLARRAGIDGQISPHSLRHAFATIALDAGVSLHALQDSMGHADPRTTRRYDRARNNLQKSAGYDVASALA
jgi:site-specific recombinase XerD